MNTNNIVSQENLNGILLEMLRGAKDAGTDIYGASKTGIIKAVDFAHEQAPLVVQEFCRWHFFEALFAVVFSIIAMVVLGYGIRWIYKATDWNDYKAAPDSLFCIGVLSGIILFPLYGFYVNTKQAIKISVAPRVYLIEWVSDTVKENRHK